MTLPPRPEVVVEDGAPVWVIEQGRLRLCTGETVGYRITYPGKVWIPPAPVFKLR